MPLTPEEQERLAYIQGDIRTAQLFAELEALQDQAKESGQAYQEGYDEGYQTALDGGYQTALDGDYQTALDETESA